MDSRNQELAPAFKGIFAWNGWLILLIILILALLDVFLRYSQILGDEQIYYQTFGDKVAVDNIREGIETGREFEWMGYLLVPVLVLVRVSFAAFCLNIGGLFGGHKLGFKKFFRVAMVGDTVIALKLIITSLLLAFVLDVQNLFELGSYVPLSLLSLIGPENVDPYFYYPLQTLNLFEVAYWFVLALGVKQIMHKNFGKSFLFVMGSYGLGLLVWMVIVVFLTINVVPGG